MVVVLLFLTISLSNETKKVKSQHTGANQGVNDDNSVRITENLARLADGLTNISIEIQRVDSDLAYHSNNVASDLAYISSRIDRVENSLDNISVS